MRPKNRFTHPTKKLTLQYREDIFLSIKFEITWQKWDIMISPFQYHFDPCPPKTNLPLQTLTNAEM